MITIENVKELEEIKTPKETKEKLKEEYTVKGNLNEYLDNITQKYPKANLVSIMRYLPQFVDNYLDPVEKSIWLEYYNHRQSIQEIKFHLHMNTYAEVKRALKSIDKKFRNWVQYL